MKGKLRLGKAAWEGSLDLQLQTLSALRKSSRERPATGQGAVVMTMALLVASAGLIRMRCTKESVDKFFTAAMVCVSTILESIGVEEEVYDATEARIRQQIAERIERHLQEDAAVGKAVDRILESLKEVG